MVSEYVVFGLATEEAVKHTVLGLLARGKQVKLVIDATASCDDFRADMALKLMLAKGARIITTCELAPDMQPRPDLDILLKRRTEAVANGSGIFESIPASPKAGGNGHGHNGKGTKAYGGNGGNGEKVNAHAGNGKDNGRSKSATTSPAFSSIYRTHIGR